MILTEPDWNDEAGLKAYLDELVTDPVSITGESFDDALNVLPPARWGNCQGIEMFFVIERYTHNLVNWYFKIPADDPLYFVCLDYDNKSYDDLAEKVMQQYNKLN